MADELDRVLAEAMDALQTASTLEDLGALRTSVLGRRGKIAALMQTLPRRAAAERAAFGARLNQAREALEAALQAREADLAVGASAARLAAERLDVTLPGRRGPIGRRHVLRRTLDDVGGLAGLRPNVRVCKGIYVEPADIAYQGDEAIRFNFVETMTALWEGGAKVAVATHDDALVAKALDLIREGGLGPERYEFQLLLGVREELADELVRGGHTVRIYVPYGQKWYEYSLRRLQENPKLAGYVARDTLRRFRP